MITDASRLSPLLPLRVFSRSLAAHFPHNPRNFTPRSCAGSLLRGEPRRARLDLHRIASELDGAPRPVGLTFRRPRRRYQVSVTVAAGRPSPQASRSIHGFSLMMGTCCARRRLPDVDGAQNCCRRRRCYFSPSAVGQAQRRRSRGDMACGDTPTSSASRTCRPPPTRRELGVHARPRRCALPPPAARLGAALRQAAHLYGGGTTKAPPPPRRAHDLRRRTPATVLAHALLLCLYTVGCLVGTAEALPHRSSCSLRAPRPPPRPARATTTKTPAPPHAAGRSCWCANGARRRCSPRRPSSR